MADGRQDGTERECILEFLAARSEASYARLFRAFAPQLISFFTVRGVEPAAAEDLTQEVLLTVYRKHGELRDPALFRPWLFKIARNIMLQDRRSALRRIQTTDLDLARMENADRPRGPGPAPPVTDWESWMAYLKPDERQIMTLRYMEGFEYHEIASILDLAVGTVQWKIFHSKKKLAAHFKGTGQ